MDNNPRKRRRSGQNVDNGNPPTNPTIPISLGKPSLRLRLEAYYSLIAPDAIANQVEWKRKFDLIYDKYGGSVKGEAALATKLAKKYGTTVRLRLTQSLVTSRRDSGNESNSVLVHDEEWYKLTPLESGSGIVDFTSNKFDPVAALSAESNLICEKNPFTRNSQLLDNIAKFQYLLPKCDPQRKASKNTNIKGKSAGVGDHGNGVNTSEMKKKIPVLTAMAAEFENSGPLSLLHSIHVKRQRVRVMIRYVDCIRGTLTGYLLAFDKHMNMMLRDVDETYSSRVTRANDGMNLSKAELELLRRGFTSGEKDTDDIQILSRDSHRQGSSPILKQRHCKQLLVRGDNVVMVWRAEAERSVKPTSEPSPKSMYTR